MQVVFQPAARLDVVEIYQYYLDQGVPAIAERFLSAIECAAENLGAMPLAGSPKFFGSPALNGLRTWPITGFRELRLYYLPSPDQVAVIRVLHDKRSIASILG